MQGTGRHQQGQVDVMRLLCSMTLLCSELLSLGLTKLTVIWQEEETVEAVKDCLHAHVCTPLIPQQAHIHIALPVDGRVEHLQPASSTRVLATVVPFIAVRASL